MTTVPTGNSLGACNIKLMFAAAEVVGPMGTARRLAPVLKALADENRLAILLALLDGDRSVTELTSVLGLSQTLVSHHLKALRETKSW